MARTHEDCLAMYELVQTALAALAKVRTLADATDCGPEDSLPNTAYAAQEAVADLSTEIANW